MGSEGSGSSKAGGSGVVKMVRIAEDGQGSKEMVRIAKVEGSGGIDR